MFLLFLRYRQLFQEMVDVVVIGGGPVGCLCANLLGASDVNCVLLEQAPDIFPLPRAVHVDDHTLRALTLAGIERLHDIFAPLNAVSLRGAQDQVVFKFERENDQQFGWSPQNMFYQPDLEERLRGGLRRFQNVSARFGHRAVAIQQDDDGVTVRACTSAHANSAACSSCYDLRAKFVVGSDGARSLTRKTATNARLKSLRYDVAWLCVDAFVSEQGLPRDVTQYCRASPNRMCTFVPCRFPHARWELMLLPGEQQAHMERPEVVHELLRTGVPAVDMAKVQLRRSTVYTFHGLCADSWRQQRVLIAGDAAHQTPPFMGHGLCSGLEDVANLCWKLTLVTKGVASARLLDSYQAERQPHAECFIQRAVLLGYVMGLATPWMCAVRDAVTSFVNKTPSFRRAINAAIAQPVPLGAGGLRGGNFTAAVGLPLPQPRVRMLRAADTSTSLKSRSDITVPLDQLLGSGFAVVGLGHDPLAVVSSAHSPSEQTVDALWKQINTRFVGVGVAADSLSERVWCVEDGGELRRWAAEHAAGCALVVVRPDRYVFGAYTANRAMRAANELRKAMSEQASYAPLPREGVVLPVFGVLFWWALITAVLCTLVDASLLIHHAGLLGACVSFASTVGSPSLFVSLWPPTLDNKLITRFPLLPAALMLFIRSSFICGAFSSLFVLWFSIRFSFRLLHTRVVT